jgi:D-amino-acid dehydrogenase
MGARMQQVIVIGGGVIGLTSAWWLLEAGFGVTLVEREAAVGAGASHSNGGQLSYRYVAPFADQGVPLKALRWLFQPDGPLRFKPELDVRQWRWLAQFLAHCRADISRKTTERLLALGELSRQSLVQLELALPKDAFAWREAGKLVVYRSRKGFDAVVARGGAGPGQVMSPAECVALEPALAAAQGALAGGIYNSGEAVADCHAFCQALLARLEAHPRFGGVVHAQVRGLVASQGKISGIATGDGVLAADAYVLAAGIRSRDLAATAGIYLPLYPIKGYSLTAPIRAGDLAPQVSVTDFERKVLYARIGDKLRVAAMADIVGESLHLDPRRVAGLTAQVRTMMPRAADYGNVTAWAGLRPATPSGAPVIGPTPYANLWLNVGHGGLGFTFACGCARILADLMRGRPAPIAIDEMTLR